MDKLKENNSKKVYDLTFFFSLFSIFNYYWNFKSIQELRIVQLKKEVESKSLLLNRRKEMELRIKDIVHKLNQSNW